jgi:hypothetical protein
MPTLPRIAERCMRVRISRKRRQIGQSPGSKPWAFPVRIKSANGIRAISWGEAAPSLRYRWSNLWLSSQVNWKR